MHVKKVNDIGRKKFVQCSAEVGHCHVGHMRVHSFCMGTGYASVFLQSVSS